MERNFIIHQEAKTYEWSGACFLSVKSFYKGNAHYRIKQRTYDINPNNYLILNECTNYRLTIDSAEQTGSFCVFFEPEYVSKVVCDLYSSDEQLLDFKPVQYGGIRLFERMYGNQGLVSELLRIGRIKSDRGMSPLEHDEFQLQLLNAIIAQNHQNHKSIDVLQSKKASTRKELYQRLLFVKDHIDSNYRQNLRLKDLAEVGLLSENHLLRNFRRLYGITPFHYISKKRIHEAKRLLLEGNTPVKAIAMDLGYTSLSNFSSYFKLLTGQSPTTFRNR